MFENSATLQVRPRLQINYYPEQVQMARKAALYLCRELTEHTAARIAEHFGRKPATIRRAVEAVGQLINSDLDFPAAWRAPRNGFRQ
jgi:chromosomal replication initiation ATPase DnaA